MGQASSGQLKRLQESGVIDSNTWKVLSEKWDPWVGKRMSKVEAREFISDLYESQGYADEPHAKRTLEDIFTVRVTDLSDGSRAFSKTQLDSMEFYLVLKKAAERMRLRLTQSLQLTINDVACVGGDRVSVQGSSLAGSLFADMPPNVVTAIVGMYVSNVYNLSRVSKRFLYFARLVIDPVRPPLLQFHQRNLLKAWNIREYHTWRPLLIREGVMYVLNHSYDNKKLELWSLDLLEPLPKQLKKVKIGGNELQNRSGQQKVIWLEACGPVFADYLLDVMYVINEKRLVELSGDCREAVKLSDNCLLCSQGWFDGHDFHNQKLSFLTEAQHNSNWPREWYVDAEGHAFGFEGTVIHEVWLETDFLQERSTQCSGGPNSGACNVWMKSQKRLISFQGSKVFSFDMANGSAQHQLSTMGPSPSNMKVNQIKGFDVGANRVLLFSCGMLTAFWFFNLNTNVWNQVELPVLLRLNRVPFYLVEDGTGCLRTIENDSVVSFITRESNPQSDGPGKLIVAHPSLSNSQLLRTQHVSSL